MMDEYDQANDILDRRQNDPDWNRRFAVYAACFNPGMMILFEAFDQGFSTITWGRRLHANIALAPTEVTR